jgi:23S rRNA (uridine2552-2'-O)-methyltransferase
MPGTYNRKDHFYQKAKEQGLRSRAAYKLLELNDKHHLFRPGFRVLDLGAWPGGWLQVAAEKVGHTGLAVGIDLVPIEPLGQPQAKTLTGNAKDPALLTEALHLAGGQFDAVLSDMSPKLSGIKEADRAAAIECAQIALDVCRLALKAGGQLVIKVFKSPETEVFVKKMRSIFNKVTRSELDSSRKTSSEFYIIGHGYKG